MSRSRICQCNFFMNLVECHLQIIEPGSGHLSTFCSRAPGFCEVWAFHCRIPWQAKSHSHWTRWCTTTVWHLHYRWRTLTMLTTMAGNPTWSTAYDHKVAEYAGSVTLVINVQETNLITTITGSALTLRINGDVDQISKVCYLVSSILPKWQAKTKITHRIYQARTAFVHLTVISDGD